MILIVQYAIRASVYFFILYSIIVISNKNEQSLNLILSESSIKSSKNV